MPTDREPRKRAAAFWRRVLSGATPRARLDLYTEIASMTAAGIAVRQALRFIAERQHGARRRLAQALSEPAERGESLSSGLRAHPELFPPIETELVAAGERTGRVDAAFRATAAQVERTLALRNRVISAALYPLFLVHFGIVVLSIPLVGMQRGLGAWLLFVVPVLLLLWGALGAAVTAHVAFAESPRYGRALFAVPVLGRALRAAALSRFLRALSALHGAGVQFDEALLAAGAAAGNGVLREEARAAARLTASGESLTVALAGVATLPRESLAQVAGAEQSGDLESALLRVADLEQERADASATRATALLPGCLVALVALGVAWVAYAVVWRGYFGPILEILRD